MSCRHVHDPRWGYFGFNPIFRPPLGILLSFFTNFQLPDVLHRGGGGICPPPIGDQLDQSRQEIGLSAHTHTKSEPRYFYRNVLMKIKSAHILTGLGFTPALAFYSLKNVVSQVQRTDCYFLFFSLDQRGQFLLGDGRTSFMDGSQIFQSTQFFQFLTRFQGLFISIFSTWLWLMYLIMYQGIFCPLHMFYKL